MDTPQEKSTYEEKKARKEQERSMARRSDKSKKGVQTFVRLFIVLVILGGLVFLFARAVQKELPQGENLAQYFESQGAEHIADGATHPPYSSNPPSSGPHYNTPAPVGFYRDTLPDERVVHNLEHGDIWIAYKPDVSEDIIVTLREFEFDGKVIITPREQNEFDVSLAAWEWVDGFDVTSGAVDTERIADFIKRYRNRGPEKVNQPHVSGSNAAPAQQHNR